MEESKDSGAGGTKRGILVGNHFNYDEVTTSTGAYSGQITEFVFLAKAYDIVHYLKFALNCSKMSMQEISFCVEHHFSHVNTSDYTLLLPPGVPIAVRGVLEHRFDKWGPRKDMMRFDSDAMSSSFVPAHLEQNFNYCITGVSVSSDDDDDDDDDNSFDLAEIAVKHQLHHRVGIMAKGMAYFETKQAIKDGHGGKQVTKNGMTFTAITPEEKWNASGAVPLGTNVDVIGVYVTIYNSKAERDNCTFHINHNAQMDFSNVGYTIMPGNFNLKDERRMADSCRRLGMDLYQDPVYKTTPLYYRWAFPPYTSLINQKLAALAAVCGNKYGRMMRGHLPLKFGAPGPTVLAEHAKVAANCVGLFAAAGKVTCPPLTCATCPPLTCVTCPPLQKTAIPDADGEETAIPTKIPAADDENAAIPAAAKEAAIPAGSALSVSALSGKVAPPSSSTTKRPAGAPPSSQPAPKKSARGPSMLSLTTPPRSPSDATVPATPHGNGSRPRATTRAATRASTRISGD
jgi:hypothetical protein